MLTEIAIANPESQLLERIRESETIGVSFSEDLTPTQVLAAVKHVTSLLGKVEEAANRDRAMLIPALGDLLGRVRRSPETLRLSGYSTIGAFVAHEIKPFISPQSAYLASKILDAFPGLTPGTWQDIGVVNLALAEKFIPPDASENQRLEVLEAARASTKEFKEFLNEHGWASPDQMKTGMYELLGSKEEVDELKRLLDDEIVVRGSGGGSHMQRILVALATAQTEWMETPGEQIENS